MPRHPEPVNLIVAKGKSHIGQKEIEERQASELHVPFTDVHAPEYLSVNQKAKFDDIANKLLALEIMTELDVDCLARYVLAHDMYLAYTSKVTKLIKNGDLKELKEIQALQDKAFRQSQAAARELGLSITSRARIVVPPPPEEDDEL